MKRLLLLRHAKAVPHGTMNDFDRVLADRGRRDMGALAGYLSVDPPDLALVSPAARTRETWALCNLPHVPVRYEEAIYEASLPALVRIVQSIPGKVRRAILVGHNPSLEDFAASLAAPESHLSHLPTAGLVLADWDTESWGTIAPDAGRLAGFISPATLGEAPK